MELNMMHLLIASIVPAVTVLSQSDNSTVVIGCTVEGKCTGKDSITQVFSTGIGAYDTCQELCLLSSECRYFSHENETSHCTGFSACPAVSSVGCTRAPCVSSDYNCEPGNECFRRGRCNGRYVSSSAQPNATMCRQEAAASPTTPVYFTYDVDKGICTLTADCDEIDWFSTSCIRGDGKCEEDYA